MRHGLNEEWSVLRGDNVKESESGPGLGDLGNPWKPGIWKPWSWSLEGACILSGWPWMPNTARASRILDFR